MATYAGLFVCYPNFSDYGTPEVAGFDSILFEGD